MTQAQKDQLNILLINIASQLASVQGLVDQATVQLYEPEPEDSK